jgi:hypothetical protein
VNLRELVLRVLDALEDGDVRYAVALLLAAIDEPDAPAPGRCSVCGVLAWPGQDERHLYSAHRTAEQELKRAA